MYLSKIEYIHHQYIYQLKHIPHGSVSDRFLLFFIVFKKVLLSSFGPEVQVVERIEDNNFFIYFIQVSICIANSYFFFIHRDISYTVNHNYYIQVKLYQSNVSSFLIYFLYCYPSQVYLSCKFVLANFQEIWRRWWGRRRADRWTKGGCGRGERLTFQ